MVKRKLTLPLSTRTKRLRGSNWDAIGRSFFGTLGDPIGTVISLGRGQTPSWARKSSIKPFDHRKGFLGGIINSMGTSFLKDMLSGAIDASTRKSKLTNPNLLLDPRLLAYKLINRNNYSNQLPLFVQHAKYSMPYIPVDVRKSGISDVFLNLLQNPTVRSFGKQAALGIASYAIPKVLNYLTNGRKKKKKNSQKEI